jgi:hypothetical protein
MRRLFLITYLLLGFINQSIGQEDTSYYSINNGLNTEKEIKPLLAFRVSPVNLSLNPRVNLGAYLGVEFSDYKKYFSFDASILYNYFQQKDHRSADLGYKHSLGHYSIKSELGFSFIFKKESFESVLKKDKNKQPKPVKHQRYGARLGMIYQERFIWDNNTFHRSIDTTNVFYHAYLKPRDILMSIGLKARVTKKKKKLLISQSSKSIESYIFFDVMFLIYNIEHEIISYQPDYDVEGFTTSKIWAPIKKIPAGARFGYQFSVRRKHGYYLRIEAGMYPGRVIHPLNALKGEISFGYQFLKSGR